MKEFYAHSVEGKPESEWQGLEEHLLNVAEPGQSYEISKLSKAPIKFLLLKN